MGQTWAWDLRPVGSAEALRQLHARRQAELLTPRCLSCLNSPNDLHAGLDVSSTSIDFHLPVPQCGDHGSRRDVMQMKLR